MYNASTAAKGRPVNRKLEAKGKSHGRFRDIRPGNDLFDGRAALSLVDGGLLAIQVPVGLYMVYRGSVTNFDALTNTLYSSHKTLGLVILALVIARLFYRFSHGAPADEPTIEWWQKAASHATHWSLYLLLLLVPIVGWLGISLYGARDVFGLFSIPPLAGQDQAAAEGVLRCTDTSRI